jgi:2,5-diketo-D-gluconate reductase A
MRVKQVPDPAFQELTDAGAGAALLRLWRRPVAVRVDAGHLSTAGAWGTSSLGVVEDLGADDARPAPPALAAEPAQHSTRVHHDASIQDWRSDTVPTQNRHVTLNNGVQMPILGFGVFQVPPDQTEQAVTDALAIGYRHLDTAEAYRNEEAVGRAIGNSGIPRDELFVTTKLWVQDGGEDGAKRAFEQSLQRLGLDYLDLYLIHQPFGDYYSSWRAMQDLYTQGVIRAIGVANFYPDRLVDLIDHNEVTPAVNQIETHPFFQRQDYQQLMRERGVQLESWGPFAEGRNNLFSDPTLAQIGAAHGKSVAQVVLRWLIQREVAANPKSVRPERMAENLDVFDFQLTDEEMTRIAAMDTGASVFFDHRDPEHVSRIGNVRGN